MSFLAIAESGGFRRAAERLGVEQSALSRIMRALEDGLGVSLFERHRGGVRTTNAGKRFLEDIRPLLAQLDKAVTAVQAAGVATSGTLRVGLTASLSAGFLREIIKSWRALHPQVALRFQEASPSENLQALVERKIDVLVGTGSCWPRGLAAEPLWTERAYIALPMHHPLSNSEEVDLGEFGREHFIVTRDGYGPEMRDFLVKRLADLGISRVVNRRTARRSASRRAFAFVG